MIIGRNYYESQKLYSTGDCELDELLEKAFCEGYEYAQREFGKLDKQVIAKLKNIKVNEVTPSMVKEFRAANESRGTLEEKLWEKASRGGTWTGGYVTDVDKFGLKKKRLYTSDFNKGVRRSLVKGNGHYKGDTTDVARRVL